MKVFHVRFAGWPNGGSSGIAAVVANDQQEAESLFRQFWRDAHDRSVTVHSVEEFKRVHGTVALLP